MASTVQLANRLGLRVVAEGVEDHDTAAALTAIGAHLLPGYLISRPMLAGTLDAWRSARSTEDPSPHHQQPPHHP